jgi:hypothetical protein
LIRVLFALYFEETLIMAIVIIQPTSKTMNLRLWKYELIPGKKSKWVQKNFVVPYEPFDTRFRSVCHYLDDGWKFFTTGESPEKGAKSVRIPLELLESIRQDEPTYPESAYAKIDFSRHWRDVDRRADIEARKPKGMQKTVDHATKKLLQQYRSGVTLKPYQLKLIEELL